MKEICRISIFENVHRCGNYLRKFTAELFLPPYSEIIFAITDFYPNTRGSEEYKTTKIVYPLLLNLTVALK
jgi:hypothetical protein